jgi:cytidyltransferase-like protein
MEESLIFEEQDIPPMQKKTATVIIGRFQPPHAGHYKVIQHAWKFTKEKDLDALILVIVDGVNTSKDKKTNPLTSDERIRYIKNSGKANWVKDILVASNAFDALVKVREAGYEPIAIAAGDDRSDKYLVMLDKYFLDNDGKPIKHFKVPGLERNKSSTQNDLKKSSIQKAIEKIQSNGELDVEEASGSLARAAVEHGFFDEFVKIVGLEKNLPAAKQMFNKIKKSLNNG